MMIILVKQQRTAGAVVWHPDMEDVRCGVRTARRSTAWCSYYNLKGGTVLYEEGSDVRTVNGFVLPRDPRGLECASPKYRPAEETQ